MCFVSTQTHFILVSGPLVQFSVGDILSVQCWILRALLEVDKRMEAGRMDGEGPSASKGIDKKNKKSKKLELRKQIKKTDRLVHLYKRLTSMIHSMEQKEFDAGWSDERFWKHSQKLERLVRKRIQIFRYLARKGDFITDSGEDIAVDTIPRLVVSTTGVEELNTLLTEFINKKDEESLPRKLRVPYKHVTTEVVEGFVEEIRNKGDEHPFPKEASALEQFIVNVACEVNKQIKSHIEQRYKQGLKDWFPDEETDSAMDFESAEDIADRKESDSASVPSWENARMALLEAFERGELTVANAEMEAAKVDETEMTSRAEKDDDDEDSSSGEEDDDDEDTSSGEEDDDDENMSPTDKDDDDKSCDENVENEPSENDVYGDNEDGGENGGDDKDCGEDDNCTIVAEFVCGDSGKTTKMH